MKLGYGRLQILVSSGESVLEAKVKKTLAKGGR